MAAFVGRNNVWHRTLSFAAVRTGKAVVFAIDIPHTDCHLHPPMFRQQPLITVGDTGTDTPTLITGRLEIRINAEGELYLRHIVFAPEHMETEKMPVKFFAKPVTVFGLHKPMLPLLALVKLKRVERTGNVQRGFYQSPIPVPDLGLTVAQPNKFVLMPTCAVAVVDTQHSKDKNAIMQIFFISITFYIVR